MATFYVSTTGSDTTGNGSQVSPWKTLAKATATVASGNTIHVNAGTYTEGACFLKAGVSIEGDGKSNTLIKSTATGLWSTFIEMESPDNTNGNQSISNVTLDGQANTTGNQSGTGVGVWITGRSNVSIHDVKFQNFYMSGAIFAGNHLDGITAKNWTAGPYATGNSFYNNESTNCAAIEGSIGGGSGSLMIGWQDGMDIHHNNLNTTARPLSHNGWPIKFLSNGYLKGVKIHDNTLIKSPFQSNTPFSPPNWDFCIEFFNVQGMELYNNYIQGSVDINYVYKGAYPYGLWAHHNTLNNPNQNFGFWESGFIFEFKAEHIIVENNVINNKCVGISYNTRGVNNNGGENNYACTYGGSVGGCSGIINNVIRNNVFSNLYNGNGAPGGIVTISEATNDVQIDGLYVYNNTLSAKTTGGTYNGIDLGGMGSGANTKNIFIRNNIFQNFQSNPIVRQSGGSQSNVQITNNDFWNNSNNGVSWTGATLANNQTVNPGFVSATDFHLQPTSLLIDKGFTPLTLPGYVQPAPFTGSAPDLGAFETGSGNQPPVANAGADQSITLPANSVSLSGTGSDSDGTIASYAWVKVSGPAGELIGSPSSATTSVSNLSQGTYVFRLTVTDNLGATGTDTVQVTVNSGVPNVPPVSNAGADQSIALPTASITLSGSGSDSDGTVTSFAWSKVSGPAATIVSPSSSTTQVNGLVVGTYVFQLTVTDNDGATGTDTVQVVVSSAPNVPPVANAGADKVVILPANSVSLGGSGSDSDGTIVSYSWSKVSGPAATITSPASANTTVTGLTAGVYVFQLTVTDNSGATGADTVQVTVNNATNQDSTKVITYVYSGNAAAIAAGLTAGMLYRLSNGNVKVVY